MTQTVVSISDICIKACQSGNARYSEPGIALLMPGEKPLLGQQAQNALRQQPTRINSRFWSDLNTDAIQINNTPIRHNADLAWNQLSQIKANLGTGSDAISICVPSNLNQSQLQLLTGICQSLELQVSSLINLGIAQLTGNLGLSGLASQEHSEITHFDLQLHQLVLSDYRVSEGKFELNSQEIIQDIGFLRFIDRTLNLLREKFIQSSRFDPLHSGDTEQQLFNQIIQMINTGEHRVFHVHTAQKQHKIELGAQELSALASDFKQELSLRAPSHTRQAYAPVFSQLPGFQFSDSDIPLNDADTEQGTRLLNDQHLNAPQSSAAIVYIRNVLLQTPSEPAQTSQAAPLSGEPDPQPAADPAPEPLYANAILFEHQVYQSPGYADMIKAGVSEGLLSFTDQGVTDSTNRLLSIGERITMDSGKELVAVHILPA